MSAALGDVGVGLVGPGAIGDVHARAIASAGGRVVAVAGPRATETAQFAARHDIARRYPDIESLLGDQDVTAVVLATPSPMHAAQTEAALRAGKHVLCEIPIGTSLAETESVVAASAAAGLHASVAHTLRFCEPHQEVRARVESGDLELRHVIGRSMTLRQRNVGWTGRRRDWTDSVLWHHAAHLVDAALWFLDTDVVEVFGGCGTAWPGSGSPMDVGAVLRSPSGGLATLSLSYHSRMDANDLLLIAENETLEIRQGKLVGPAGVIVDSPGASQMVEVGVKAQDEEFLSAVAEARAPAFTVADVLPTMRVLETLHATRMSPLST